MTRVSEDLEHLVHRARRRLAWHHRLDIGVRALCLGACCVAAAAVWRGVVDPHLPWLIVGGLAFLAGLMPWLARGFLLRISPDTAAWYLDRKLGAGGRILTLAEAPRSAGGKRTSGFHACIEEEVSALLARDWAPSTWRRSRRIRLQSAALFAVSLVVLLLGPGTTTPVQKMQTSRDRTRALARAAERLGASLETLGEAELGEALGREGVRFKRGEGGGVEFERLARALEERLKRQGVRESIRSALEASDAGREIGERIFEGAGDAAAFTTAAEDRVEMLERAAELPGLPEAVRRHLRRSAEALRKRDAEAFAAARSRIRELLGEEISSSVLLEAGEVLAAMGGEVRGEGYSGRTDRPGPEAGLIRNGPGPGGNPAVRGDPGREAVLDPNLRRVIRKYFERDETHE